MMLHDPHARLDYQIDWSAPLGADTISGCTWEVSGGLVVESSSNTANVATVWLSVAPGTPSGRATATNTITTAGGRIDQRTLEIQIANL